jgi:glycosyltransferase involved in cell wall biosynthesis
MPLSRTPNVSIIIPTWNEEAFISACLDSILLNDYPKDKIDIIILDGMSSDQTPAIIQKYISRYPFIRLINNPKRIQAPALNLGIKESRGEIIIRMDAHTLYDKDYIANCVKLLMENKGDNVGGVQNPIGTNYISKAIAIATSTPFGVGNAYFRFSKQAMFVDTVYLGAWKKDTLIRLNGFNEQWVINEDYELNYRLRKSGGKILLSPSIKSAYFVRSSLRRLSKQYFRYGFWKAKTIITYPESLKIRQFIPPAFAFSLIISLLISPFVQWPLLIIGGSYTLFNLIYSFLLSLKKGVIFFAILPVVFTIIHLTWGIGFLSGLLYFSSFKSNR